MYQLETKEGKVLYRGLDLAIARAVKQQIHQQRGIWLNIIKRFSLTSTKLSSSGPKAKTND